MTLNDYCDRVFVISLDQSFERWTHVLDQCERHGLKVERFRAYDGRSIWGDDSIRAGEFGCAESHRALWHVIAHHGWKRVCVLEDDFLILHADFQMRFARAAASVPPFDLLYLGAHYGDPPKVSVAPGVIAADRILTTSSYIITADYARYLAPRCDQPVDAAISRYNAAHRCYVLQPRLMAQFPCVSTIQHEFTDNSQCMRADHGTQLLRYDEPR